MDMSTPPDQPSAFSFNSAPTSQLARQLIGDRVRTARMAANMTQQEQILQGLAQMPDDPFEPL